MKNLYLDSRDLIRMLAKKEPLDVECFHGVLRNHSWQLVYSFANIREVVVVESWPETDRRLDLLLSLPHAFVLPLPRIQCEEFKSAVAAFCRMEEPTTINPFSVKWLESWHPSFLAIARSLESLHLKQAVSILYNHNPDIFKNTSANTAILQSAVNDDRLVTDSARRGNRRKRGDIAAALLECRILPPREHKRFAEWVLASPSRCPGWRIFHEVYLEFCSNTANKADDGDVNDYSHISAMPYIDSITLDRRMRGYSREALKRISGQEYCAKIFENAQAWLDSIL